jgi:hypothetical protein
MSEKPQATVHPLHTARVEKPAPKKKSRKKKSVDLASAVVAGAPVFTAGLNLLENVPRLRPYMAALRLLANAGQVYLANTDQRKKIEKIKKIRHKMKVLDMATPEYAVLHEKLLQAVDLL